MSATEGADAELPRYPGLAVPRTGGAAVVVRALRKKSGAKEAVAGIDLEVAAGSLAGLVGPSRAGKTTSLSMMTGLRPDSGRILIKGIDVWKDPPAAKAVRALSGVLAAACRACGLACGSGWTMAQGARGRKLDGARPGSGSGQAARHGLVTAAPEDRARRQAAGGATRRRLAAGSLR
jgi:energy-coupling factor transporter ATP-binding protein EcfA2